MGSLIPIVIGALLGILGPTNAAAQGLPAAVFARLLADLGAQRFAVRETAEVQLTQSATCFRLSGAQTRTLQTAAVLGADPEVRVRAERIFRKFARSLASYQLIEAKVQVQLLRPFDFATNADGQFRFDTATGRFGAPGTTVSWDVYNRMDSFAGRIMTALGLGDVEGAFGLLARFREMVQTDLTDFQVASLILRDDAGAALVRADVVSRIDDALTLLGDLQRELQAGGAVPDPGARPRIPVPGPGLALLGSSLSIDIPVVVNPGSVDLASPDTASARALAPPGFQFVGHLYRITAEDGLVVGEGTMRVTIEYGDPHLLGVDDPAQLLLVRVADGLVTFLATEHHDMVNGRLTAFYTIAPGDPAPDRLGQVGLVLPALRRSASWTDWQQNPDHVKQFPTTTNWTNACDAQDAETRRTPRGTPALEEEGPYYRTREKWKTFRLTIDYRTLDANGVTPNPPGKKVAPSNEHFGNSGVYIFNGVDATKKSLFGLWEVQIIDPSRFGIQPGMAVNVEPRNKLLPGSAYGLDPPGGNFTNRGLAGGDWNTLDIVFCPPVPQADPARATVPARIRAALNLFVVFDGAIKTVVNGREEFLRGTGSRMKSAPFFVTEGYVYLQSHWGSQVEFRDPVLRELAACPLP